LPTQTRPIRNYAEKLLDVIAKHADAMNKNDAGAAAACFRQGRGLCKGQRIHQRTGPIEKWYADLFQNVQFSNHVITVARVPLTL
jgi:hypothetical protein